ncbi:MAG: hypothetical protein ACK4N5_03015 [Myxococcales bacterium]
MDDRSLGRIGRPDPADVERTRRREHWARLAPWAMLLALTVIVLAAFPSAGMGTNTVALSLMLLFFVTFAVHLSRSRGFSR